MSEPDAKPNVFLRHSIGYVAATTVPQLIAFPVLALYTWLVSPTEYGMYVAVMTAAVFAHALTFDWLWVAAYRLSNGRGSPEFLAATLACFAGVVGISALIAAAIAIWFGIAPTIAFLGFAVFTATTWADLNQALLRAGLEVRLFAKLAIMRSLANQLVSLSLVLFGLGAVGLLIGAMVGPLVPALWIARSTWGKVNPSHLHKTEVRKILTFGLPLIPGYAAAQLTISVDRLVLALLRPSAGLGVYSAATGMTQRMMASMLEPLGFASFPLAVQAHEGGNQQGALWRLSTNFLGVLAIGVPAAVGLALVAPDLAATVFGPAYRQEAAMLLPIAGVTYLCYGMRVHFTEQILNLARRSDAYSKAVGLMAAMSIPTSLILVWNFGVMGAAWAMLISQAFGLSVSFLIGRRLFPLRLPLRDAALVASATVVMAAVVWAIPTNGSVRSLLTRIGAGVAIYAIVTLALNVRGVRSLAWSFIRRMPGFHRETPPPGDAERSE